MGKALGGEWFAFSVWQSGPSQCYPIKTVFLDDGRLNVQLLSRCWARLLMGIPARTLLQGTGMGIDPHASAVLVYFSSAASPGPMPVDC